MNITTYKHDVAIISLWEQAADQEELANFEQRCEQAADEEELSNFEQRCGDGSEHDGYNQYSKTPSGNVRCTASGQLIELFADTHEGASTRMALPRLRPTVNRSLASFI